MLSKYNGRTETQIQIFVTNVNYYALTTPKLKMSIFGEISPRNASGDIYADDPKIVDVKALV